MRIRSALFTLALVPGALAFAVAPAAQEASCRVLDDGGTAESELDDVVACEEVHYLSCEDAVGGKVHNFYEVPVVKLTTDAPATSFTAGGGCGFPQQNVLSNVNQGTFSTFDFGGFVTTNVDTVTVEIHDIQPLETAVEAARGETVELGVRLTVNTESPLGIETRTGATGTEFTVPAELDLPVTATISPAPSSSEIGFAPCAILKSRAEKTGVPAARTSMLWRPRFCPSMALTAPS